MEDAQIVDLYIQRLENAITETDKKYKGYLHTISYNILSNKEDTEECLNDTYMRAWASIPPTVPLIFAAYIGKIIRNLSLTMYNKSRRVKRGSGEIPLILDELEDCIAAEKTVESEIEKKELTNVLNKFLSELTVENREIFMRRYWYADTIATIAKTYDMSESKVKSILFRIRNKLKVVIEHEY